MNPEAVKQVIEALERNGGPALESLAAYKAASSMGDLVLIPVVLVVGAIFIFAAMKFAEAEEEANCGSSKETVYVVGSIVSGALGLLSMVVFLVSLAFLPNTIATIKNPKGAAIESLLKR